MLTLALIGWSTVNYLSVQSGDPDQIFYFVRLVFLFITIENTAFFLLMYAFPHTKINLPPAIIWAFVSFSAIIVLMVLVGTNFARYEVSGEAIKLFPLLGLVLFIVHAAIAVLGGFMKLFINYRQKTGIQKNQLLFLMLASVVLWVIVPITNFVLPIALKINLFASLSPIFALLFASTIGYAIVKQRLFDIRTLVTRSVVYALLLVTLAGFYALALFGFSNLFFNNSSLSNFQNLVYITLAVSLAFTFQSLRRFFEKLTDRIFYHDRYDSQVALNQIGGILAAQLDINVIIYSALKIIGDNLKILHGRLLVLDQDKLYRSAEYNKPPLPLNQIALKHLSANLILKDELAEDGLKDLLDRHDISAVVRLKTRELVGYLLLGPKQTGNIYNSQDVQLLKIISGELAIGVENARSFEKIAAFNVTLQQRIKEATARLRTTNRRLEDLDEAKDEFVSMASHQLRTPLTAIKGYLSMLVDGDAGPLSHRQYEFADLARVSAERMVYLISDMLNVSRLSTGRLTTEPRPMDLEATIADEIKQLKRTAEARNVTLKFDSFDAKMPIVNLDEDKTRQVIMNFIDNAIYYAPNTQVVISLNVVGDKIVFKVKDKGIGVPRAEQPQLFTKFFRATNARRARPDGTGLGLFMAKKVIELQGGRTFLKSSAGKGSTFGFELPIDKIKLDSAKTTLEPGLVESAPK